MIMQMDCTRIVQSSEPKSATPGPRARSPAEQSHGATSGRRACARLVMRGTGTDWVLACVMLTGGGNPWW